jgi:hypothetical protein
VQRRIDYLLRVGKRDFLIHILSRDQSGSSIGLRRFCRCQALSRGGGRLGVSLEPGDGLANGIYSDDADQQQNNLISSVSNKPFVAMEQSGPFDVDPRHRC